MWRKSDNIMHKLANRELSPAAPNSHIHRARLMYENIVPNHTVYDVDFPGHYFRKFTNDGQYLICFSRNYQNVFVYRFNGMAYCSKGESSDTTEDFPAKGKLFDSYFSQLYSLNLGSNNDFICKEIFLTTDCNCYGIFATATRVDADASRRPGTAPEIPTMERITLYLVRLADGNIMDERQFRDDFIQLVHDVGIFMYDDLVTVLSIRYQAIHILQVRKSGTFVDVRTVGPFCREDDELILDSHAQEESLFQNQKYSCQGGNIGRRGNSRTYGNSQETYDGYTAIFSEDKNEKMEPSALEGSGVQDSLPNEVGVSLERNQMLGGIKQRLLSYIFRSIEGQDADPASKSQRLKRFYYHFQHYVDLVMWKVQFLDRYHLLIKFGSVDGVVSQNLDANHPTVFFVIYNIESTEVLGFFQNSSEELLRLFENYHDHFRAAPSYPLYMRFISSYSNNMFAREQFRKQKAACNNTKHHGYSQVVKRTLASLPCSAQSQNPSAYFDQNLFQFDEKHISASDQYKPCMEHPIKFLSRRKPNACRFKINPGQEVGPGDGQVKRVASFIFHPIFPFAISVQQTYMEPAVVNFHLRR